MSEIGHNECPAFESGKEKFEVVKIDFTTELGQKIYDYIKSVSGSIISVIVPEVYIIDGGLKKFQIKPDAYVIFTDNQGKGFQVTGIQECVPKGFYKQAA